MPAVKRYETAILLKDAEIICKPYRTSAAIAAKTLCHVRIIKNHFEVSIFVILYKDQTVAANTKSSVAETGNYGDVRWKNSFSVINQDEIIACRLIFMKYYCRHGTKNKKSPTRGSKLVIINVIIQLLQNQHTLHR